ncbi:MAG: hypothetical protein LGL72_18295, partial [Acidibrevibacterium sp.]|uniref:hypothetical protein n=1 Tax=Acidibrevibacterium fodinaquatile TaxID=1969806 RepID=UPI0023A897E9
MAGPGTADDDGQPRAGGHPRRRLALLIGELCRIEQTLTCGIERRRQGRRETLGTLADENLLGPRRLRRPADALTPRIDQGDGLGVLTQRCLERRARLALEPGGIERSPQVAGGEDGFM